jgi:hypothetical protein
MLMLGKESAVRAVPPWLFLLKMKCLALPCGGICEDDVALLMCVWEVQNSNLRKRELKLPLFVKNLLAWFRLWKKR